MDRLSRNSGERVPVRDRLGVVQEPPRHLDAFGDGPKSKCLGQGQMSMGKS